jgi:hypothetical protein
LDPNHFEQQLISQCTRKGMPLEANMLEEYASPFLEPLFDGAARDLAWCSLPWVMLMLSGSFFAWIVEANLFHIRNFGEQCERVCWGMVELAMIALQIE